MDSYKSKGKKLSEPTVCQGLWRSVSTAGHWQWLGTKPKDAHQTTLPSLPSEYAIIFSPPGM